LPHTAEYAPELNIDRRLTPGDGYLEALIKPNVEPVYDEIIEITETGLRTGDGSFYEVDIIVCATGFNMAWSLISNSLASTVKTSNTLEPEP
jgi:cation diffusion facilitator CzcD-associated flavoprotein CzcO